MIGCVCMQSVGGGAHVNTPVQHAATTSAVKHASLATHRQLPALQVRGGPTMGWTPMQVTAASVPASASVAASSPASASTAASSVEPASSSTAASSVAA